MNELVLSMTQFDVANCSPYAGGTSQRPLSRCNGAGRTPTGGGGFGRRDNRMVRSHNGQEKYMVQMQGLVNKSEYDMASFVC